VAEQKPFRFGVNLHRFASRAELVDRVRRAEQFGYDIVCVADHLGKFAPFPALVAAAEATTGSVSARSSSTRASTTRCCWPARSRAPTSCSTADQLRAHRARYGITYFTVLEDALDSFAGVITRLR
jgi:hypothetical protein